MLEHLVAEVKEAAFIRLTLLITTDKKSSNLKV